MPTGYLICNGSAISRTTYAALFDAIGTTWGTGDGSTTFTLPNLINRVAWGASTAGTYKAAGLPNITGKIAVSCDTASSGDVSLGHASGCIAIDTSNAAGAISVANTNGAAMGFSINASRSSSIYSSSTTTVQPPAATLIPIIKY